MRPACDARNFFRSPRESALLSRLFVPTVNIPHYRAGIMCAIQLNKFDRESASGRFFSYAYTGRLIFTIKKEVREIEQVHAARRSAQLSLARATTRLPLPVAQDTSVSRFRETHPISVVGIYFIPLLPYVRSRRARKSVSRDPTQRGDLYNVVSISTLRDTRLDRAYRNARENNNFPDRLSL